MIAAVYARKSTDQSGIADEHKSVTRQIEHARAYATRKGWTVPDEYVYVDDGISGAEFSNRPGFVRLMAAIKPRAPFQVLLMSEESRLGREQIEVGYALKQLITGGVRVFCYLEDRERTLDSPIEKAMLSLQTMADEMEREKARLRVSDAMSRKARAGYCCGGTCFGYDNVPVVSADGRRSHVERRINEAQAAIVRRMFDLCAAGTGYTRIAKQLNAEGAPAPRPKQGRPAAWAPTSVKEVLERRVYLGEAVWNRTRKRNVWGQARQSDRPEAEWIRRSAPELRIVSDAQWQAAHDRLGGVRARLAAATGQPLGNHRPRDLDSQYLLAGFARCAVCGGGLGVVGGSHSSNRPHVYGCLSYHKRGASVCANQLRLPLSRVDDAVLRAIGGEVLRPPVVMAIVDGVLAHITPQSHSSRLAQARATLRQVEQGISNLARALSEVGELGALLDELRQAREKREALLQTIADLEHGNGRRFDRPTIEAAVHHHLAGWRTLLASAHVRDGRQLLREVLDGPLRFTPDGRAYRFAGEARLGDLLVGAVGLPTNVVAVRGSAKGYTVPFAGIAA
jgi:site-specific DNA recombinase